jgi:membrane-associated phospholipid phosphatase
VSSPHISRGRVLTTAAVGYLVLTLGLLLVGWIAHELIFEDSIGTAELDLTRWISEHRQSVLDSMARTGSSLSDAFTVIGVAFGATVILWATGHHRQALVLPVGLVVELTVFLTVSTLVGRDRPAVEPLGAVPSTSSFPSGHVAAALVLYVGLVVIVATLHPQHRINRIGAALAVLAVLYVATSRVYEGVHHPTDVLCGAVVGVGALYTGMRAAGLTTRRHVDRDVTIDERLQPAHETVHMGAPP